MQLLSDNYKEVKSNSNLTILFSVICTVAAAYAYLYPEPYPKSRSVLIVCCGVYYLTTLIWTLFSRYVEGNTLFKGQILLKSGKYETFSVASSMSRYGTSYYVDLNVENGPSSSIVIDAATVITESGKFLEPEFFSRLRPLFANWRPLSFE